MTPKRLQRDSTFSALDSDNDGVLSDEELMQAEKLTELEVIKAKEKDRDAKEDQLRHMAWVAMASMIIFTLILFLPFFSIERIAVLDSLLQTFYIAQAGIVASFFGSSAYMSRSV